MTHQSDTSQACRPIRGLGGSGAGLSHSCCALLLFRLYLERQRSSYGVHSVACTGQEVHLAACPLVVSTANSTFSCQGGAAAVVGCMPGPAFMQGSGLKKKLKVSVRTKEQTDGRMNE